MKCIALILVFCASIVFGQDQAWLDDCLTAHNNFRTQNGKPPLSLNRTITEYAQNYANQLSRNCSFRHSKNLFYGENLALRHQACHDSVKSWTDEQADYDPRDPDSSWRTDGYTQVVWKATSQLGCGIARHCKFQWVTVCNYYTAGNVEGEYLKNV